MRVPESVRQEAYEQAWQVIATSGLTDKALSKTIVDTIIFTIQDHPDMVIDLTAKSVEHKNIFEE